MTGGDEVPQEITAAGDVGVVVTFGRCGDGSGGRKAGEEVGDSARGGVGSAPKDSLSEPTVVIEFEDIETSEGAAVAGLNGVDDRDGFSERGWGTEH